MKQDFLLLNKAVYFFKEKILVIGDLHLGYEHMLNQQGILLPNTQTTELKKEFEKLFLTLQERDLNVKELIFLGDITHSFGFEYQEKKDFQGLLNFLQTKVKLKSIIFIKGNHDTIDFTFGKMKKSYIQGKLLFIHGDKIPPTKEFEKSEMIILGHIHPSVLIQDSKKIKKEFFKCFLIGKFKNKKVIILPSFLNYPQGKAVNDYEEEYEDYFSIIPKRSLLKFSVFVIGEKEIFDFGKLNKF